MKIKITEFAPTKMTPCWSVYVAAQSEGGGNYAEGHAYGITRDAALSGAREHLRERLKKVFIRGVAVAVAS